MIPSFYFSTFFSVGSRSDQWWTASSQHSQQYACQVRGSWPVGSQPDLRRPPNVGSNAATINSIQLLGVDNQQHRTFGCPAASSSTSLHQGNPGRTQPMGWCGAAQQSAAHSQLLYCRFAAGSTKVIGLTVHCAGCADPASVQVSHGKMTALGWHAFFTSTTWVELAADYGLLRVTKAKERHNHPEWVSHLFS